MSWKFWVCSKAFGGKNGWIRARQCPEFATFEAALAWAHAQPRPPAWACIPDATWDQMDFCIREEDPNIGGLAVPASEFVFNLMNARTVAAPVAASAWNGRCSRCGKGTYLGFSSLEHEGGECRAP